MKHVPKYLLPRVAPVNGAMEGATPTEKSVGFVGFKKNNRDGSRHRGRGRGRGGSGGRGGKRKSDPLKKFGR